VAKARGNLAPCQPRPHAGQYPPSHHHHRRRAPMKISMNLLLWTTHVKDEHFPLFGKLKKAGYDGVELPLFEGDAAHYKTVRKQLDDNGLKSTAVCCMMPDANPISPDAGLRKAAVERMKWAIEMTAILGGENLCGPYHSPLGVFSGQGPTADEKQRAAD